MEAVKKQGSHSPFLAITPQHHFSFQLNLEDWCKSTKLITRPMQVVLEISQEYLC